MKLKKLIIAAALSTAALSASAATITSPTVTTGASFSDFFIGTITIGSLSDLVGTLFAAQSVSFTSPFAFTLSLDTVTFTSGSVGPLTGDLDETGAGFSFKDVAAGTYTIVASGTLAGDGAFKNTAFLGANYTVTAVPEPESYAMLLAGLGLMGTIARRRSKANAV